jgi:hypothetical protein
METTEEVNLTIDLAREVVTDAAPEELPVFTAISRRYEEDPEAAEREAGREEMLGFGAGELVALAPVALQVASPVIKFLFEQVREAAGEQAQAGIGALVKKLFKRFRLPEDKDAPPPLTTEQIARVRGIALERARLLKVPEAKAELLADSVAGSLVAA